MVNTSLARRFAGVAVFLCIGLFLAACAAKLEKKYQSTNRMVSVEFKSHNALLRTPAGHVSLRYEFDGDKVTLHNARGKLVLKRNSDGSLQGPYPFGRMVPVSASSSSFRSRQVPHYSSPYSSNADNGIMAFIGASLLTFLLIAFAIYAYFAISVSTIAKKTGTTNAWMAWVPIANIFLMLHIGQKPNWWFLLLLIPFVNVVVFILMWMAIAKARNRPDWWGIFIVAPLINFVLPGVLAFTD